MRVALGVVAFGELSMVAGAVDTAEVNRRIERELPSLETFYQELHRTPELSFQEVETSRRVGNELERAGMSVTRQVGGHGVVGVLTNGTGPVILLRADLDGLPIREQTGLPYSSTHQMTNDLGERVPTMHACGHDIHMGSLVRGYFPGCGPHGKARWSFWGSRRKNVEAVPEPSSRTVSLNVSPSPPPALPCIAMRPC